METKKFTVLGGDNRNIYLSKLLAEEGHIVCNYGFDGYDKEIIPEPNSLYEAIDSAEYIIGPTPCSHNGIDFNAIYSKKPVSISSVFRLIKPDQIFFAGHIKEPVMKTAQKYDVNCIDILKREELALMNAIPTAEGALKIAIENTDFTLHGAHVMVIGYGRVGKILSKMLNGIGAHVYPVVKERQDEALAKSYGYNAIMTENMDGHLSRMNIIFNTVPKLLIDRNNIKFINKSCLIIDLSSPPYGVDHILAKNAGLTVLFTGSLPGIIAPRSSAKYNMETIYNLINEIEGLSLTVGESVFEKVV